MRSSSRTSKVLPAELASSLTHHEAGDGGEGDGAESTEVGVGEEGAEDWGDAAEGAPGQHDDGGGGVRHVVLPSEVDHHIGLQP